MELKGLEKALREGCRLHGFSSGGGLRVIRLEQEGNLRGYGEHPNVEDALSHANEDFLAGGREYKEVYGKSKPHYLTGSENVTSPLDGWLIQGRTIDSYIQGEEVVVELRGLTQTEIPEDVIERVNATGRGVIWTNREYTYETVPDRFPSGRPCISTKIIKEPVKSGSDAWSYHIVKRGKGNNFFEALGKAVEAQETEIEE